MLDATASAVEFASLFACGLRNGLTKPKNVRGKGTKMVNMGEIFAHDRIRNLEMDRVLLTESERTTSLLQAGDLLFARQSLVLAGAGKCTIYLGDTEDVCFESHIIRCRLDPAVAEPSFYYYFLRSPAGRRRVEEIVEQGAGAAGVRGSDLAGIKVPNPSLTEQRRIAGILGSLDDKIELNRRMCETLEGMARAMFQSWFVDFDPVRAKVDARAEGRDPERAAMSAISGKPESELDSLTPTQFEELARTAALFPDRFSDSPLGPIPEGWDMVPMTELIEVNPPRRLQKGMEAPYIDMAAVPTNAANVSGARPRAFGSGSRFVNGDTLLARITPCLENGKTAFVDCLPLGTVGWGSTEFIVLNPYEPIPNHYAYLLCRTPAFRAFAIGQMTGTSGRQRVPNEALRDFALPKPSAAIFFAFGTVTSPIFRYLRAAVQECSSLESARDTLLPELLRGGVLPGAVS